MYRKVLEVAAKELGYFEKKTNAMLESKTSNTGDRNYTKYGKAMGCNGCAWCDAFVDWCFVQAYGKDNAKKLLGGFSNYTPTSAENFKKAGRWHEANPKPSDVIFYKNSLRICHTGIVEKVENGYVITIEGNTSSGPQIIPNGGGVHRKKFALSNPRIAGYGRPDYSILTDGNKEKKKMKVKSNEQIAQEVIRGKWGVGKERVKKLKAAGYDSVQVQKIVNKLMK